VCRDFFGLSSDFAVSQLVMRGSDKTSLFYVTPSLKQLVDCNQHMVNVSTVIYACLIINVIIIIIMTRARVI